MRWILALVLLLPASAATSALGADQPGPLDPRPARWVLEAPAPEAVAAGEHLRVDLDVHREVANRTLVGPGQANVTIQAPPALGCLPREQTVSLDPTTGQGQARLRCQPHEPGRFLLEVEARSAASRPGRWTTSVTVEPDTLHGNVRVGQPQGYRVPLEITLTPEHLDEAPLSVTLRGQLFDPSLSATAGPWPAIADGSTLQWDWLARHGPGTYKLSIQANGPLTREWTASRTVTVPEPDRLAHLELNATVEPGSPDVNLTDDAVNEDGKTKSPGDRLITRLEATRADAIDVTVLRSVDDETVTVNRTSLSVGESGRAEHVFQHEPLPAGRLWVQASVGDSQVARTARIEDLEASATTQGPSHLLADGRAWRGNVTLLDPNFGSTPLDPGPVFGLPNVTWTVYHGYATAEGFTVRLGPFTGPSEGQAATSRIPWPTGTANVTVEPGQARLPVEIEPPAGIQPGTYRLSLYAPDEDRIGGTEIELKAPPKPRLEIGQPLPGQPLPINVTVDNPVPRTRTRVTVAKSGQEIASARVNGTGTINPSLPSPLPAGTNLTVEARSSWPGRPKAPGPDRMVRLVIPDVAPNVTVHPMLDGRAVPTPVPAHPAANHTLELAYRAVDPNTGPVNATVNVTGPSGRVDWPLEHSQGLARLKVPEQAPAGRYEVAVTARAAGRESSARIAVDRIATMRLGVQGPKAVHLAQGDNRTVNLTVTNRGSLPVEAATVVVDTPLTLEAFITQGRDWAAAGEPIPVQIPPGRSARLRLALQAQGPPGQGPVNVTVAGVAP